VCDEIKLQLKSIQGSSATFAKQIRSPGSATIKFGDKGYGKHDPDAQFWHPKGYYPGVVIEVSYSQKRKDLFRLADDYILGSNGNIRVVVGLDIEYSGKEATWSVWRPHFETNKAGEKELVARQTVINQIFRDRNHKPITSSTAGIQLRLRDFTTEAVTKSQGQLRDPIFISANKLCSFLDLAESEASAITDETGLLVSEDPLVRKRRHDDTPPEELKLDDDKRFSCI
jgi:hypothetical protein